MEMGFFTEDDSAMDENWPGPGPEHMYVAGEAESIVLTGRPLTTPEFDGFVDRIRDASKLNTELADSCIDDLQRMTRVGELLAEAIVLSKAGQFTVAMRDRFVTSACAIYYAFSDNGKHDYCIDNVSELVEARLVTFEGDLRYDYFISQVIEKLDSLLPDGDASKAKVSFESWAAERKEELEVAPPTPFAGFRSTPT